MRGARKTTCSKSPRIGYREAKPPEPGKTKFWGSEEGRRRQRRLLSFHFPGKLIDGGGFQSSKAFVRLGRYGPCILGILGPFWSSTARWLPFIVNTWLIAHYFSHKQICRTTSCVVLLFYNQSADSYI
jgi:hypothetical protein